MMKEVVFFLTISRIIAGPVIFLLLVFAPGNLLALFAFILAACTDFLDGHLARKYNVESSLGAVLDPIADKVLLLFCLFSISFLTKDPFIGLMSATILSREFWVSGLREFASQNSITEATKVTYLAKIKTSIQFMSIGMFLFGITLSNALILFLASFVLFLSLLISMKTAIDYTSNLFNLYK